MNDKNIDIPRDLSYPQVNNNWTLGIPVLERLERY